ELMQKRVFDRFGMKDSSMVWRDDYVGRAAEIYDQDGKPLGHSRRKRARAAGSMDTTLDDYARFMAAVLRGDGLSPQSARAMLSPQLAIVSPQQFPSHWPGETDVYAPIKLAIGLGWPVYESNAGPAFFKEGSDDGTNNLALGFVRHRSGIVMLSNSSNTKAMFKAAVEAAFGEVCLPWFWMGYIPYDRPELTGLQARGKPVPACAP
ncbi:MAG TPA: serine hydrolase domain-containing protein, partial [Burkholderiaceae bacterium]